MFRTFVYLAESEEFESPTPYGAAVFKTVCRTNDRLSMWRKAPESNRLLLAERNFSKVVTNH